MNYQVIILIAILVVIGMAAFIIRYQHERLREQLVLRAHTLFPDTDIQKLEEFADSLMGPEMRQLCSCHDADFRQRIKQKLQK